MARLMALVVFALSVACHSSTFTAQQVIDAARVPVNVAVSALQKDDSAYEKQILLPAMDPSASAEQQMHALVSLLRYRKAKAELQRITGRVAAVLAAGSILVYQVETKQRSEVILRPWMSELLALLPKLRDAMDVFRLVPLPNIVFEPADPPSPSPSERSL